MAYTTDFYVEHIADVDGNARTYRIEILKESGTGNNTELKGWGDAGVFSMHFERLSREQLFEGIAQKGRLELHLSIQNSTHLSILTDIISADEDDYRLRLKQGGNVKWTGFVIPDLISYSEGDYPFAGTITAKDLSLIEAEDYETNTVSSYRRYSFLLADLLNSTDLDLDIHTYNDWTASQISGADDYFNQTYLDKFHLQNFTSFSQGSFEPIDKLEALRRIIPPGYILRQWNNVWNLFSVDYLAKSSGSSDRYEYDETGTKTGSTGSVDLTEDVDRVDNFLLGTSVNKPWLAFKQLRLKYNHKSSIQNLLFKNEYTHTGVNDRSSEDIKVSDTTGRVVEISGSVEVTSDTDPGSGNFRSGDAELIIQVDDYELDISTGSFGLNTGAQQVSVSSDDTTLTGSFTVRSSNIPNAVGESTLTVELRWATISGETVTQVRWHDFECKVINTDDIADSAANNYRLTQSGTFSSKMEVPTTLFGQGPDDESNSAIRYNNAGQFDKVSGFKHVGGSGVRYERFVLDNLMNLQRNIRKSIDAELLALYSPRNLLTYDSVNYLFLDGVLTGYDARWRGTMVELNWQTGSDTFESFIEITDKDSGSTIAVSSGSSSTNNTQYLKLDGSNQMSGNLNMGGNDITNLGAITGSGAGDFGSLEIGGTTALDSSRNLSAVAGTFTGPVTFINTNDTTKELVFGQHGASSTQIRIVPKVSSSPDFDHDFYYDFSNSKWGFDGQVDFEGAVDVSGLLTAETGMTSEGTTIVTGSTTPILRVDSTSDTGTSNLQFRDTSGAPGRITYEHTGDELYLWASSLKTVEVDTTSVNVLRGDFFVDFGGIAANDTSMQGYTALYANGTTGLNGLLTVHDDIFPNANYTSNIGSAAKKFLTAHIAELRAELMTIEERRVTTGGRFNVGIGNVLASDLSAGATTISVEYDNLNNGDIIHLEKVGQVEFISVDSAASGTGPYSYDITRNLDGTGANAWTAGDGIFNTGQSGSGFIDMYATTSLLTGVTTDGPTTAYMQRTGATYNDIDVRAASGNIKGWYGVGSDEFGFAAGKYDSGNGNYIILTDQQGDLQIDTWNLETTTLILESTTPKLAMGSAASSLGLSSTSDTGTFVNGSGHWRAGTTDGSGNISKGFKFDGSNAILKANNAEIDTNSGWFGASDILAYSASSVTIATFTANNQYLTNGQTYIGENLSQFNVNGSGNLLVGDFGTAGTDPRFYIVGLDGQRKFLVTTQVAQALDDLGNTIFQIDLDGTNDTFIGGTYFDQNNLWLGSSSKGSATVLLDGTNGKVITDSIGADISLTRNIASFGRNPSGLGNPSNEWSAYASRINDGTTGAPVGVVIQSSFIKRFGEDTMIIKGRSKFEITTKTGVTHVARIDVHFTDVTGSQVLTHNISINSQNNYQTFQENIDISSLTDNQLHMVELFPYAEVTISAGQSDGSPYDTEAFLFEWHSIRTAP